MCALSDSAFISPPPSTLFKRMSVSVDGNNNNISENNGNIIGNNVTSGNIGNVSNSTGVILAHEVCSSRPPEFIVLLVFEVIITLMLLGILLLRIRKYRSKKSHSAEMVDVEQGKEKIMPPVMSAGAVETRNPTQRDSMEELNAVKQINVSLTQRIRDLEAERQPTHAPAFSDTAPAPRYTYTPNPFVQSSTQVVRRKPEEGGGRDVERR
ncbi:hypothetical protein C8R43DRAFT_7603 [Mycena crocata]|nr:hypothetical protein C8R43DRAFT_7603 [Mycena crocata]